MNLRSLYQNLVPLALRDKIRPLKHPLGLYISQVIKAKSNYQVMTGPFKGMKYNENEPPPLLRLLGTYEIELRPAIDILKGFEFDRVINIGAAEGYYAVGMSLLYRKALIYAFEAETEIYHHRISRMAVENLVAERIKILGLCKVNDLKDLLQESKKTLLILDAEGSEIEFLDPEKLNGLERVAILVELHDMNVPKCSEIIYERFKNTHRIERYITRPRTLEDFPFKITIPSFFTEKAILNVMFEERLGVQNWFLMLPLNNLSVN